MRWCRYFAEEMGAEVSVCLRDAHLPLAQKMLPQYKCYSLADIPDLLPEVGLTILVTVGNDPGRWWPLLSGHTYWMVGHNLSMWLGAPLYDYRPKTLARYFRDRWRRPKLLRLIKNAQYLLVPTASMRSYLLDRQPQWPVVNFPFAFPKMVGSSAHQGSDSMLLRLFIPGRVDTRFRDYGLILQALRSLPPDSPKIEIVLAGRVVSAGVVDQFLALGPSVTLVYQQEGLDDQTFHAYLSSCDFVIAPLRPSVRSGAYREYIGYTKISGAVFDAVAADKELVLPAWHPVVWRKQKAYRSGIELIEVLFKSYAK